MGCVKLLKGLDLNCLEGINRYYQNLVLINRSDVDESIIKSNNTQHRVSFNLHPEASGILFSGNEAANIFEGTYNKSEDKGIPLYTHNLQLPIIGVEEEIKVLLKQLDSADFFAAIQFQNGIVEIYGFENGLSTDNYTYQPQSSSGGAIVPLTSRNQEYNPPYIYYGKGLENQHFNTLFAGIGPIIGGDFNNDFSNDFDNIYIQ